ncbi:hypothetical protein ACFL2Y_03400, partial [Candidatus Omnitrophota bacterium]
MAKRKGGLKAQIAHKERRHFARKVGRHSSSPVGVNKGIWEFGYPGLGEQVIWRSGIIGFPDNQISGYSSSGSPVTRMPINSSSPVKRRRFRRPKQEKVIEPQTKVYEAKDGTRITYDRFGPQGAKEAIFLIHGYFTNAAVWFRIIRSYFLRRYPDRAILTLDVEGHWRSKLGRDVEPGNYFRRQISYAPEICREEGIERATFGGSSMGGVILFGVLRKAPALFAGEDIIGTTPIITKDVLMGHWLGRRTVDLIIFVGRGLREWQSSKSDRTLWDVLWQYLMGEGKWFQQIIFTSLLKGGSQEYFIQQLLPKMELVQQRTESIALEAMRYSEENSPEAVAEAIREASNFGEPPGVLIILGTSDKLVNLEEVHIWLARLGEELEKRLPDKKVPLQVVVIDEKGHAFVDSEADFVAYIIDVFKNRYHPGELTVAFWAGVRQQLSNLFSRVSGYQREALRRHMASMANPLVRVDDSAKRFLNELFLYAPKVEREYGSREYTTVFRFLSDMDQKLQDHEEPIILSSNVRELVTLQFLVDIVNLNGRNYAPGVVYIPSKTYIKDKPSAAKLVIVQRRAPLIQQLFDAPGVHELFNLSPFCRRTIPEVLGIRSQKLEKTIAEAFDVSAQDLSRRVYFHFGKHPDTKELRDSLVSQSKFISDTLRSERLPSGDLFQHLQDIFAELIINLRYLALDESERVFDMSLRNQFSKFTQDSTIFVRNVGSFALRAIRLLPFISFAVVLVSLATGGHLKRFIRKTLSNKASPPQNPPRNQQTSSPARPKSSSPSTRPSALLRASPAQAVERNSTSNIFRHPWQYRVLEEILPERVDHKRSMGESALSTVSVGAGLAEPASISTVLLYQAEKHTEWEVLDGKFDFSVPAIELQPQVVSEAQEYLMNGFHKFGVPARLLNAPLNQLPEAVFNSMRQRGVSLRGLKLTRSLSFRKQRVLREATLRLVHDRLAQIREIVRYYTMNLIEPFALELIRKADIVFLNYVFNQLLPNERVLLVQALRNIAYGSYVITNSTPEGLRFYFEPRPLGFEVYKSNGGGTILRKIQTGDTYSSSPAQTSPSGNKKGASSPMTAARRRLQQNSDLSRPQDKVHEVEERLTQLEQLVKSAQREFEEATCSFIDEHNEAAGMFDEYPIIGRGLPKEESFRKALYVDARTFYLIALREQRKWMLDELERRRIGQPQQELPDLPITAQERYASHPKILSGNLSTFAALVRNFTFRTITMLKIVGILKNLEVGIVHGTEEHKSEFLGNLEVLHSKINDVDADGVVEYPHSGTITFHSLIIPQPVQGVERFQADIAEYFRHWKGKFTASSSPAQAPINYEQNTSSPAELEETNQLFLVAEKDQARAERRRQLEDRRRRDTFRVPRSRRGSLRYLNRGKRKNAPGIPSRKKGTGELGIDVILPESIFDLSPQEWDMWLPDFCSYVSNERIEAAEKELFERHRSIREVLDAFEEGVYLEERYQRRRKPDKPQFTEYKLSQKVRKKTEEGKRKQKLTGRRRRAQDYFSRIEKVKKAMVIAGYSYEEVLRVFGLKLEDEGESEFFHFAKRHPPTKGRVTQQSLIEDGLWGRLPSIVRQRMGEGVVDPLYIMLDHKELWPLQIDKTAWGRLPWWRKVFFAALHWKYDSAWRSLGWGGRYPAIRTGYLTLVLQQVIWHEGVSREAISRIVYGLSESDIISMLEILSDVQEQRTLTFCDIQDAVRKVSPRPFGSRPPPGSSSPAQAFGSGTRERGVDLTIFHSYLQLLDNSPETMEKAGRLLSDRSSKLLLDIGSGFTRLTLAFVEQGLNVLAADPLFYKNFWQACMLALAGDQNESFKNIVAIRAEFPDIFSFLSEESLDYVTLFNLGQNLTDVVLMTLLRGLIPSIIRPGGQIIIQPYFPEFKRELLHIRDPYAFHPLPIREVLGVEPDRYSIHSQVNPFPIYVWEKPIDSAKSPTSRDKKGTSSPVKKEAEGLGAFYSIVTAIKCMDVYWALDLLNKSLDRIEVLAEVQSERPPIFEYVEAAFGGHPLETIQRVVQTAIQHGHRDRIREIIIERRSKTIEQSFEKMQQAVKRMENALAVNIALDLASQELDVQQRANSDLERNAYLTFVWAQALGVSSIEEVMEILYCVFVDVRYVSLLAERRREIISIPPIMSIPEGLGQDTREKVNDVFMEMEQGHFAEAEYQIRAVGPMLDEKGQGEAFVIHYLGGDLTLYNLLQMNRGRALAYSPQVQERVEGWEQTDWWKLPHQYTVYVDAMSALVVAIDENNIDFEIDHAVTTIATHAIEPQLGQLLAAMNEFPDNPLHRETREMFAKVESLVNRFRMMLRAILSDPVRYRLNCIEAVVGLRELTGLVTRLDQEVERLRTFSIPKPEQARKQTRGDQTQEQTRYRFHIQAIDPKVERQRERETQATGAREQTLRPQITSLESILQDNYLYRLLTGSQQRQLNEAFAAENEAGLPQCIKILRTTEGKAIIVLDIAFVKSLNLEREFYVMPLPEFGPNVFRMLGKEEVEGLKDAKLFGSLIEKGEILDLRYVEEGYLGMAVSGSSSPVASKASHVTRHTSQVGAKASPKGTRPQNKIASSPVEKKKGDMKQSHKNRSLKVKPVSLGGVLLVVEKHLSNRCFEIREFLEAYNREFDREVDPRSFRAIYLARLLSTLARYGFLRRRGYKNPIYVWLLPEKRPRPELDSVEKCTIQFIASGVVDGKELIKHTGMSDGHLRRTLSHLRWLFGLAWRRSDVRDLQIIVAEAKARGLVSPYLDTQAIDELVRQINPLTDFDQRYLQLMAEGVARGLTKVQIAEELGVNYNTLKSRAHVIYRKLNVRSIDGAIDIVLRGGIDGRVRRYVMERAYLDWPQIKEALRKGDWRTVGDVTAGHTEEEVVQWVEAEFRLIEGMAWVLEAYTSLPAAIRRRKPVLEEIMWVLAQQPDASILSDDQVCVYAKELNLGIARQSTSEKVTFKGVRGRPNKHNDIKSSSPVEKNEMFRNVPLSSLMFLDVTVTLRNLKKPQETLRNLNMASSSPVGKDVISISAMNDVLSLRPDEVSDSRSDEVWALRSWTPQEPEFLIQKWLRLIRLFKDTTFDMVGWHNTNLSELDSMRAEGLKARPEYDYDLFFGILDFSNPQYIQRNAEVLELIALALIEERNTYGKTKGTHTYGVVLFPLDILHSPKDKWRSNGPTTFGIESLKEYPDHKLPADAIHTLDMAVSKRELDDVVAAYFQAYGEDRALESNLKILYLRAVWLDRLIRFGESMADDVSIPSDKTSSPVDNRGDRPLLAESASSPVSKKQAKQYIADIRRSVKELQIQLAQGPGSEDPIGFFIRLGEEVAYPVKDMAWKLNDTLRQLKPKAQDVYWIHHRLEHAGSIHGAIMGLGFEIALTRGSSLEERTELIREQTRTALEQIDLLLDTLVRAEENWGLKKAPASVAKAPRGASSPLDSKEIRRNLGTAWPTDKQGPSSPVNLPEIRVMGKLIPSVARDGKFSSPMMVSSPVSPAEGWSPYGEASHSASGGSSPVDGRRIEEVSTFLYYLGIVPGSRVVSVGPSHPSPVDAHNWEWHLARQGAEVIIYEPSIHANEMWQEKIQEWSGLNGKIQVIPWTKAFFESSKLPNQSVDAVVVMSVLDAPNIDGYHIAFKIGRTLKAGGDLIVGWYSFPHEAKNLLGYSIDRLEQMRANCRRDTIKVMDVLSARGYRLKDIYVPESVKSLLGRAHDMLIYRAFPPPPTPMQQFWNMVKGIRRKSPASSSPVASSPIQGGENRDSIVAALINSDLDSLMEACRQGGADLSSIRTIDAFIGKIISGPTGQNEETDLQIIENYKKLRPSIISSVKKAPEPVRRYEKVSVPPSLVDIFQEQYLKIGDNFQKPDREDFKIAREMASLMPADGKFPFVLISHSLRLFVRRMLNPLEQPFMIAETHEIIQAFMGMKERRLREFRRLLKNGRLKVTATSKRGLDSKETKEFITQVYEFVVGLPVNNFQFQVIKSIMGALVSQNWRGGSVKCFTPGLRGTITVPLEYRINVNAAQLIDVNVTQLICLLDIYSGIACSLRARRGMRMRKTKNTSGTYLSLPKVTEEGRHISIQKAYTPFREESEFSLELFHRSSLQPVFLINRETTDIRREELRMMMAITQMAMAGFAVPAKEYLSGLFYPKHIDSERITSEITMGLSGGTSVIHEIAKTVSGFREITQRIRHQPLLIFDDSLFFGRMPGASAELFMQSLVDGCCADGFAVVANTRAGIISQKKYRNGSFRAGVFYAPHKARDDEGSDKLLAWKTATDNAASIRPKPFMIYPQAVWSRVLLPDIYNRVFPYSAHHSKTFSNSIIDRFVKELVNPSYTGRSKRSLPTMYPFYIMQFIQAMINPLFFNKRHEYMPSKNAAILRVLSLLPDEILQQFNSHIKEVFNYLTEIVLEKIRGRAEPWRRWRRGDGDELFDSESTEIRDLKNSLEPFINFLRSVSSDHGRIEIFDRWAAALERYSKVAGRRSGQIARKLTFFKTMGFVAVMQRLYQEAIPGYDLGEKPSYVQLDGLYHSALNATGHQVPVRNDVEIRSGRLLIFVGPNGCGKTVLLQASCLAQMRKAAGFGVSANGAQGRDFEHIIILSQEPFCRQDKLEVPEQIFFRKVNFAVRAASDNTLILIDELLRGCSEERMMPYYLEALEMMLRRGAAVVVTSHAAEKFIPLKDIFGDEDVVFMQSDFDAQGNPTFSFTTVSRPHTYTDTIYAIARNWGWPYPLKKDATQAVSSPIIDAVKNGASAEGGSPYGEASHSASGASSPVLLVDSRLSIVDGKKQNPEQLTMGYRLWTGEANSSSPAGNISMFEKLERFYVPNGLPAFCDLVGIKGAFIALEAVQSERIAGRLKDINNDAYEIFNQDICLILSPTDLKGFANDLNISVAGVRDRLGIPQSADWIILPNFYEIDIFPGNPYLIILHEVIHVLMGDLKAHPKWNKEYYSTYEVVTELIHLFFYPEQSLSYYDAWCIDLNEDTKLALTHKYRDAKGINPNTSMRIIIEALYCDAIKAADEEVRFIVDVLRLPIILSGVTDERFRNVLEILLETESFSHYEHVFSSLERRKGQLSSSDSTGFSSPATKRDELFSVPGNRLMTVFAQRYGDDYKQVLDFL